jgi:hypothetical protein
VSCAQAWHYFASRPKDPAIIKYMVSVTRAFNAWPTHPVHLLAVQAGAILVFDTAHEALVLQAREFRARSSQRERQSDNPRAVYWYTVDHFGNVFTLLLIPK